MKTLFIECNTGIAGDMLAAALWELTDDKETALSELNSIGLPDTVISFEPSVTCGIGGTKAVIIIGGEEEGSTDSPRCHTHRCLADVNSIIDSLNLTYDIKERSKEIYGVIAEAESKVHKTTVSQVHFHELGMLDAIADVVICTYLIGRLKADRIIVSPINTGNGNVRCAHGILPVPAPAAAEILKGVPCYKSNIYGELCTPTGAALAKSFADEFSDMPEMTVDKIGYGIGSREYEQANCVRAFLGECKTSCGENITELVCNIDDMTAEELSFACEMLFEAGALDVYTQSACMKKSRLGTILTVLCRTGDRERVVKCIFRHTSTIGIRERICRRYTLDRKSKTVNTPFGKIRVKLSSGYETQREKYEYDDLKQLARDKDISIFEAEKIAEKYIK